MKRPYTLASFFAGVGGIELGFEQSGEFKAIYANEFDQNAQITYARNFSEVDLDRRDIKEVEASELPDVDIITGGFPCQAFSIAGYRLGFEDERGDLFFELFRIIKEKQPRVVFIENVKNMVSHDDGRTFKVILETLVLNGYDIHWQVLNSAEYGNIPQNRERIYIVGFKYEEDYRNFEFPRELELKTELSDLIDFENEKDEIFYYRKGKQDFYDQLKEVITSQDTVYQWRRKYVRENKSGLVPTLTANMGTGGHNVPLVYTKHGIRKLTPRETFNIQGFPKDYQLGDIANSHLYKQAGNSVTVPVIRRIAEQIVQAMEKTEHPQEKSSLAGDQDSKYAVIFVRLNGRFEGKSRLVGFAKDKEEAQELANKDNGFFTFFVSDKEYKLLVKNQHSGDFYMNVQL